MSGDQCISLCMCHVSGMCLSRISVMLQVNKRKIEVRSHFSVQ